YALKSCSLTGEGKTVVSDFDFLPEIGDFKFNVNQQYIHISSPVNCDNDRFYNIKTGEVTETEYLDGLLYNYNDIFIYEKPVSETDFEVYLINGKDDYKLLCSIEKYTEFVKSTSNGYYLEKFNENWKNGEISFNKIDSSNSTNNNIHSVYEDLLDSEKYDGQHLPQYALYDFDDDGTQELLIWDIRVATAAFRDVFVYKYDAESGDTIKIGKLEVFQGHCHIGESADKNGIAVAVRDTGSDYIKEYYYDNGEIKSKTLLERNDMSSSEWWEFFESSEYFSGVKIEMASDYSLLDNTLK
ncbi:MAG: hypothetical protein ACI4XH_08740, partial [Acutalibacteraceae bacterium]